MKKVDIVIGAGYGDEGKGLTVDYLASKGEDVAVARFSGGANAGHTVELEDGTRHVFHHFGSGTFVGAHTILTRDFVVNPFLFWREAEELAEKIEQIPHVYIDPECLVTTPYDVYLNQEAECVRNEASDGKHGSTGTGLGETIQRDTAGYRLRIKDFFDPIDELRERIEKIRDEYFWKRLKEIGGDEHSESLAILEGVDDLLMENVFDMIHQVTVVDDHKALEAFDHVIFEGSQGLFLDQNSRDFPHVTRANTGLTNVAQYLNDTHEICVHYISRTYLTRHGAGKLEHEDCFGHPCMGMDKTNVDNEWQGHLRYAPLDFVRMKDEVSHDLKHISHLPHSVCAVMTWAKENDQHSADMAENMVVSLFADKALISYGKTREDMVG